MGVLPSLFKLWPWVDLDPFYAKVKSGHLGFCMGKSENYFFETFAALGLKVYEHIPTKWVHEVKWVSKVKVIHWPSPKVTQTAKLELVFFLRNYWVIWNQSSCESLWENDNENSYMTKMAAMSIYGKTFYMVHMVKTFKNLLQNQWTDGRWAR